MENHLGSIIAQARKARKMTQAQVAAAFGISRPAVGQWESGETSPGTDRLPALAELLGIDLNAAMQGEFRAAVEKNAGAIPPAPSARIALDVPVFDTAALKGPRNVPVYGTGSGGDGGDFRFNGQTIDHAPRPPGIENRRDVYVVYVIGDSVSPKYEDGDPIYVDPHRRPQPRDYVLVELQGPAEGEPGPAYVKRLVGRSGGRLRLEQHNPAGPVDFDEGSVVRVHRVIPYPELIGI